MQAWVFRHLDQLRSIYGTGPSRGAVEGAAGVAMAPGTTARADDAGVPDVILAPMTRQNGVSGHVDR